MLVPEKTKKELFSLILIRVYVDEVDCVGRQLFFNVQKAVGLRRAGIETDVGLPLHYVSVEKRCKCRKFLLNPQLSHCKKLPLHDKKRGGADK